MEKCLKNIKDALLTSPCKFEPDQVVEMNGRRFFGRLLNQEALSLSDSVILTPELSKQLLKLCEFSEKFQFKLIYRGSEHGFETANFYSKCKGHAKTLTIIKDTTGSIFGGYLPISWDSKCYNVYSTCIIYSLVSTQTSIFSHANTIYIPEKAYIDHYSWLGSEFGPVFGRDRAANGYEGGSILKISNRSNTNNLSSFYFTRTDNMLRVQSGDASFQMLSRVFQTCEIEVHQNLSYFATLPPALVRQITTCRQ